MSLSSLKYSHMRGAFHSFCKESQLHLHSSHSKKPIVHHTLTHSRCQSQSHSHYHTKSKSSGIPQTQSSVLATIPVTTRSKYNKNHNRKYIALGLVAGAVSFVSLALVDQSQNQIAFAEEKIEEQVEDEDSDQLPNSNNENKTERRKINYQPVKFEHLHREANDILTISTYSGLRLTAGTSILRPLRDSRGNSKPPSKNITFVPILSLGEANTGNQFMLQIISQLGSVHQLVGIIDSSLNIQGKYKFTPWPRWSYKAEFQAVPENDAFMTSLDYKAPTYNYSLQTTNIIQDITFSSMFTFTPSIVAGLQLYTIPGQMVFLNPGIKYTPDGSQCVAASYRTGTVSASYFKKVDQSTAVATDIMYSTMNNESIYRVGLCFQSDGIRYFGGINSQGHVLSSIEAPFSPGIMLSFNASLAHDGSNETTFGFGVNLG